jgi:hypothetical protein
METGFLLEIIQNRIESNDNNPTSGSLLCEIYLKLEDLKRREDNDALIHNKQQ